MAWYISGRKLKALRARYDLTQDELAEISGLSRATIQNAEAGYKVRPETARRIINALLYYSRPEGPLIARE